MNKLILLIAFVLVATDSFGFNYKRFFRDLKLNTQQLIEKQNIVDASAYGVTDIVNAWTGALDADGTTLTSSDGDFITDPDVPRTVVVRVVGQVADAETCNVVVRGTNYFDDAIGETVTLDADVENYETTTYAYKSITSVELNANCEASPYGASWSVGYGGGLGFKRCMNYTGDVIQLTADGTYEGTRPTVTVGSSVEVESQHFIPNTASDGSVDYDLYFMQNFRCLP